MNPPTKAHLRKCLSASLRLMLYVVGISGTFGTLGFLPPGLPISAFLFILAMMPVAAGALVAAVETRLKSPWLGYILLLLALLLGPLVKDPNFLYEPNELIFAACCYLLVLGSIGYGVTAGLLALIKSRKAAQTDRG